MNICAISPFASSTSSEVLGFIRSSTADLIVLPGLSENTPTSKEVQDCVHPHGIVFSEYHSDPSRPIPVLIYKNKIHHLPKQVFARNPTSAQVRRLEQIWQERTIRIGERKCTFILCGEINAFNPDGSVKFNRALPFDILINPSHTPMSRWQHLNRKLSILSQRSLVIHNTNNTYDHQFTSIDLRAYFHGTLSQAKQNNGKISWLHHEV